jgi:hypothetical protein
MTIQIAVINESTVITNAEVQAMIPAFVQQWNNSLVPVWGVEPANFSFVLKGAIPALGAWWLVFLDNSDQAGALAYHDLTSAGLPISKVFVKTLLADKASISVGASHELVEMGVDPWLNSAYQDTHGIFWAGEVADPCESDSYGSSINGVLVTDFVTPNWFGHQYAKAPFDINNHLASAFQVLPGGYAQHFGRRGWVVTYGARITSEHGLNPAIGSRRERRARGWQNWKLSAARRP